MESYDWNSIKKYEERLSEIVQGILCNFKGDYDQTYEILRECEALESRISHNLQSEEFMYDETSLSIISAIDFIATELANLHVVLEKGVKFSKRSQDSSWTVFADLSALKAEASKFFIAARTCKKVGELWEWVITNRLDTNDISNWLSMNDGAAPLSNLINSSSQKLSDHTLAECSSPQKVNNDSQSDGDGSTNQCKLYERMSLDLDSYSRWEKRLSALCRNHIVHQIRFLNQIQFKTKSEVSEVSRLPIDQVVEEVFADVFPVVTRLKLPIWDTADTSKCPTRYLQKAVKSLLAQSTLSQLQAHFIQPPSIDVSLKKTQASITTSGEIESSLQEPNRTLLSSQANDDLVKGSYAHETYCDLELNTSEVIHVADVMYAWHGLALSAKPSTYKLHHSECRFLNNVTPPQPIRPYLEQLDSPNKIALSAKAEEICLAWTSELKTAFEPSHLMSCWKFLKCNPSQWGVAGKHRQEQLDAIMEKQFYFGKLRNWYTRQSINAQYMAQSPDYTSCTRQEIDGDWSCKQERSHKLLKRSSNMLKSLHCLRKSTLDQASYKHHQHVRPDTYMSVREDIAALMLEIETQMDQVAFTIQKLLSSEIQCLFRSLTDDPSLCTKASSPSTANFLRDYMWFLLKLLPSTANGNSSCEEISRNLIETFIQLCCVVPSPAEMQNHQWLLNLACEFRIEAKTSCRREKLNTAIIDRELNALIYMLQMPLAAIISPDTNLSSPLTRVLQFLPRHLVAAHCLNRYLGTQLTTSSNIDFLKSERPARTEVMSVAESVKLGITYFPMVAPGQKSQLSEQTFTRKPYFSVLNDSDIASCLKALLTNADKILAGCNIVVRGHETITQFISRML